MGPEPVGNGDLMADIARLKEMAGCLSMEDNPETAYFQTKADQNGRKQLVDPGQAPPRMNREVQVKCRLLGICAQCLTHRSEGQHLDFVWGCAESQCTRMAGMAWTWEDWKKKFGQIRFDRLYNSVGMVDGRVRLSPWLEACLPKV